MTGANTCSRTSASTASRISTALFGSSESCSTHRGRPRSGKAPRRRRPYVSTLTPDVGQDAIELEFWQSVQASGDPVEYAAYLERYPEGIFAPLARERLSRPAPVERPAAEPDASAVELAFWDTVKTSDNPAMLQAYLDKFPDGTFKALAEIRLDELEQADEPGAA